jgi:Na+/H+ antiporter NhaA
VRVVDGGVGESLASPVTLGVVAGLVLGKPLGITLAAWAAVRAGVAVLPAGASWRLLHAVSWLGGIRFAISLFSAVLRHWRSRVTRSSIRWCGGDPALASHRRPATS